MQRTLQELTIKDNFLFAAVMLAAKNDKASEARQNDGGKVHAVAGSVKR